MHKGVYNRSMANTLKTCHVYTDGSSHGNPGPSAYAFLVCDDKDRPLSKETLGFSNPTAAYIGEGTNNLAEYSAIEAALKKLKPFPVSSYRFVSDSELIVKQLNGVYRVKHPVLSKKFVAIKAMLATFPSVTFSHVKRDHPNIFICDRAANAVVDTHQQRGPSPTPRKSAPIPKIESLASLSVKVA